MHRTPMMPAYEARSPEPQHNKREVTDEHARGRHARCSETRHTCDAAAVPYESVAARAFAPGQQLAHGRRRDSGDGCILRAGGAHRSLRCQRNGRESTATRSPGTIRARANGPCWSSWFVGSSHCRPVRKSPGPRRARPRSTAANVLRLVNAAVAVGPNDETLIAWLDVFDRTIGESHSFAHVLTVNAWVSRPAARQCDGVRQRATENRS